MHYGAVPQRNKPDEAHAGKNSSRREQRFMTNQRTDALTLWYDTPAAKWTDALPLGNGRLGVMLFGGIFEERLALNELTLWAGGPHDYDSPDALAALPEIRRLVFAGEWAEAQALCNEKFMGRPIKQMPYQTAGDLRLPFPGSGGVDRLPARVRSGNGHGACDLSSGRRDIYPRSLCKLPRPSSCAADFRRPARQDRVHGGV